VDTLRVPQPTAFLKHRRDLHGNLSVLTLQGTDTLSEFIKQKLVWILLRICQGADHGECEPITGVWWQCHQWGPPGGSSESLRPFSYKRGAIRI